MTAKRYPRRIVPMWWSWQWRQLRRRLITRRPPEPFEPGYAAWAADQAERITQYLQATRRGR